MEQSKSTNKLNGSKKIQRYEIDENSKLSTDFYEEYFRLLHSIKKE